jgi:ubiquinone/menaquinone biosynthesis C-methylase UbiE
MIKGRPIPNFVARIMFKMHSSERLKKEIKLIRSGLISPGDTILDFACGPGNLSVIMAEETGDKGEVYALDIHPLAIENTEKLIRQNNMKNIKTILTNKSETGLSDNTIDIVFIFNAIDMIRDKQKMTNEIERVLKPEGKLIIRNKLNFKRNINSYKNLFSKTLIEFSKQKENSFYFTKKQNIN